MRYRPKPHQSPKWSLNGVAQIDVPNEPSRWEKFLLEEQIEDKDIGSDPRVLKFLMKNYRTYFVPTKVLKMYGMEWEEM